MESLHRAALRYLLALCALVAFWQIASIWLGEFLLPSPLSVARYFPQAVSDGDLFRHVGSSFWRVAVSLILAFSAAFPVGLVLGRYSGIDRFLSPMLFLTYPLPKIVLLPVFLTLFGIGDLSRVLLISFTVAYQIAVVVRDAARHIEARHIDSFKSMSKSEWMLFRYVLIPASMPSALTALKVGGGTAVAVLFMAESFATDNGLGFYIMDAWGRGDQTDMFCGIVSMSALGVIVYESLHILERRICRWTRIRRIER